MLKIQSNKNIRFNLKTKTLVVNDDNIVKKIKNDPELFLTFKCNIAVCFQDSYYRFKKKFNKKYINAKSLHKISNDSADNFLKILINSYNENKK
jgi:hypothetical protein